MASSVGFEKTKRKTIIIFDSARIASFDRVKTNRQKVSLLDAALEKYQEDMQDESHGVLVSRSPSRTTDDGRLLFPETLSMDACGIDRAGDEEQLLQLFALVEDLDLMKNELSSWDQILIIFRSCPSLRSINLSLNPLGMTNEEILWPGTDRYIKLVTLALNNTYVTWQQLLSLLPHLPGLQELHIAMNDLSHVPHSSQKFLSVNRLIYNSNSIERFEELIRIGKIFPCLEHLLVASNCLKEVGNTISKAKTHDRLVFKFLSYLNLSENSLSLWTCIDELALLPTLIDLRLNGNPILEKLSVDEARMQVIARLPGLLRLNGSPISEVERENAERGFIRLHLGQSVKPSRYYQLVKKHGNLNPLAHVDLSPQSNITFIVRLAGEQQTKTINIDQTVGDLKKDVCQIFGKKPSQLRLFYLDKEINAEDELKYPRRKMHSYRPKDGDELILSPK